MEESAIGGSEESLKEDGDVDLESSLRRMKPPNKKKFDEELEALLKIIREKEVEFKSARLGRADDPGKGDASGGWREIRAEKDATIERRKKIDASLKALNAEITKHMGALSKLQSNLHYKSEERINEAIRRLEYQLKHQNFRLSEEKKIVNEIDSLKRSKKVLIQFLAQKKEIDEMRDKQRRMREEREHYFKAVSNLKSREDDMRKKTTVNKSKNEGVKKEIDALYEQKRSMVAEFKKYEKEYYSLRDELRKKQRQASVKRREEEKRANMEALQKEIAEYEAQKEPFEDEKQLCNTLITYLQKFLVTMDKDGSQVHPVPTDDHSLSAGQPASAIAHEDGVYVLYKKQDEELFGGISRKGKKGSKKKKMPMHKPVTHTPQIFAQFSSLSLSAPSNISEVASCIEQLQARKKYYDNFVKQSSLLEDQSMSSLSVSVSDYGASESFTESLLSESGVSGTWSLQSAELASVEDCEGAESTCESATSEMLRQTSKTESTGSGSDNNPTCDSIVDALAQQGRVEVKEEVTSTLRAAPSPALDEESNSSPECDSHIRGANSAKTENCDPEKTLCDEGKSNTVKECSVGVVVTNDSSSSSEQRCDLSKPKTGPTVHVEGGNDVNIRVVSPDVLPCKADNAKDADKQDNICDFEDRESEGQKDSSNTPRGENIACGNKTINSAPKKGSINCADASSCDDSSLEQRSHGDADKVSEQISHNDNDVTCPGCHGDASGRHNKLNLHKSDCSVGSTNEATVSESLQDGFLADRCKGKMEHFLADGELAPNIAALE